MLGHLKTPIATRFVTALLSMPQPMLDRIAGVPGQVVQDGQVLNPSLGALAALGERFVGVGRVTPDVHVRRRQMSRFAAYGLPKRTDVRVTGRMACLGGPERGSGPERGEVDRGGVERPVRIYRPFGLNHAVPGIVYFHRGVGAR